MFHLTSTAGPVATLAPRDPVTVHPARLRSDPLAWRSYVLGESSFDPDLDFDACGCEFPAGFQSFPAETDQTELWEDGYQSFADESEPILWTPPLACPFLSTRTHEPLQASIVDEFIQRFPEE